MNKSTLIAEYQKIINENPFAGYMQMELLDISKGYVKTKVRSRTELENIYGDMHGGALYTVADNIAGIAAATYGYYVTTVDGSIQYLKAARNTEYIICEAKTIKAGRTISVIAVEITDENGMLINTANFTYYNIKEKESRF